MKMMKVKKTRIYIDGEVLLLPHFSGVGHYTLEMVRAIDRLISERPEFVVRILVHYRMLKKARSLGLQHIKLLPSPFSHRVSNALKIRHKQPPLDLLFGRGVYLFPNFSSWPLLFSKSVPVIYDLSFERFPQFAESRNREFLSLQVAAAVNRADLIATISENSRKEISDFYTIPNEKIHIYTPAVDLTRFFPRDKTEVAAVKKRLGIKGAYILFVGNIEPRKNLKSLLLAYERLPHNLRDRYSLLLIGGKGWQDGEIHELIKKLKKEGASILQPNQYVKDDELPALYSGASLFVYPSLYEGFGIPPLEAMACGTPVITSDNSSLPEVVGAAGVTINAESVPSLTHAMQQILQNTKLQRTLVSKGFLRVAHFDWIKSAEQLLEDVRKL